MSESSGAIESSLQEQRVFPPPPEFAARAQVNSREEYDSLYRESIDQPEQFWGRAAEELHWFKKWDKVLDWKPPNAKWFVGGKTQRRLQLPRLPDRRRAGATRPRSSGKASPRAAGRAAAGRSTASPTANLRDEVCRFANGLKKLGVKKGDRVTIYMPMVPEAAIAMLACAGIGAAHSVIFGGFSSQAIADRVEDAKVDIIITADGGFRRGQVVPLKQNVDEALKKTDRVKKVVVLQRVGTPAGELTADTINWVEGRDVWWHELIARPEHRLPRRADGRRGHALRPLHQRLDRQAQGHHAHHRRVPGRHAT